MSIAPVKSILKEKFLCVEYPGYVNNLDKAIATLGGIEKVVKASTTNSDLLPLNFRPNDPYSHHVFGDKVKTSSMILEVQYNEESKQIDHQIIGIVPQTYRFRSIADFQWLPDSMGEPNITPKEQDNSLPQYSEDDPIHLLPPIFSASDLPLDYQFQSNPFYKTEEIVQPDGSVNIEFVSKSKKETEIEEPHVIDCETKDIPSVSKLVASFPEDQELVKLLTQLFEKRPVWCKNMISAHIEEKYIQRLKHVLPIVAYHFLNGPWRKAWVRLGYDPRISSESARYQVIDFRVKKGDTRGQSHSASGKFNINPRRFRKSLQEDVNRSVLESELSFTKPPSQRQTMFQVCDIAILEEFSTQIEETYNKETGWYSKKVMTSMRQRMKEHLKILIEQWDEKSMDIEEEELNHGNDERNNLEYFLNRIVNDDEDEALKGFSDDEEEES